MLTLASPLWLLILPLPWLFWYLSGRRPRREAAPALNHPQAALLADLQQQLRLQQRHPPWLWLLGCTLLITALARPQWQPMEQPGRNFVLAMDISSSMRALDFELEGNALSRLDILKYVVDRFIDERTGDRIGLVVFGDDAYTLAPMTTDLQLLRRLLDIVQQSLAGEKTALGDAVALSVKRLQHQDKASRVLLLLTDGSNTSGNIQPETALALARHEGVRIYTIGIGSHGKVLFPRGPVQEPDYKVVPMDEAILQQLASETGGQYYRATATQELHSIIADIEQTETIPIRADHSRPPSEWFDLPLAAGTIAIIAALLFGRRGVAP